MIPPERIRNETSADEKRTGCMRHLEADPMAIELIRCGVPIGQVCELVERAAIMAERTGDQRSAELELTGEAYSTDYKEK